ncbi:MAG: histidine phosphatase family protein [Anaerolineae bacterium]
MTTRITLIRHGETDWNLDGRWQGHAPVPLNANGLRQAEDAAPTLAHAGITRIIASDLSRAYRTGEIIGAVLGLPVIPDRRWREIDLGRWQGLTMPEINAWDTVEHDVFVAASYIDRYFPEGESNRQHIARVAAALDDLVATYPGEHVLVATHGGSIRCAVYHLTGEPIHLAGNCSVTQLVHDGAGWSVRGVAETPAEVVWG